MGKKKNLYDATKTHTRPFERVKRKKPFSPRAIFFLRVEKETQISECGGNSTTVLLQETRRHAG